MLAQVPAWAVDVGIYSGVISAVVGAAIALQKGVVNPIKDVHRAIDKVFEVVKQLQPNGGESMFDRVERLDAGSAGFRDQLDLVSERLDRGAAAMEQLVVMGDRNDRRLAEVEEQVADHLRFHPPAGPKATA